MTRVDTGIFVMLLDLLTVRLNNGGLEFCVGIEGFVISGAQC